MPRRDGWTQPLTKGQRNSQKRRGGKSWAEQMLHPELYRSRGKFHGGKKRGA